MFHRGYEDERRGEGDAERLGHDAVVLVEGVFEDVQLEPAVEVLEEDPPEVVALGDEDGVLVHQVAEVGEGGAEHGVGGDVGEAAAGVVFGQAGLDRGDVRDDAARPEAWQHGVEGLEGAAERDAVDDQLGGEGLHLVGRGEAEGVIDETHAARVGLEDGHLVIEAEQVGEERTHPTRSEDKDLHDSAAFSPWFITIICWRTDSSWMFLRIACTKSGFSSIAAPALARFSRISP